MIWDFWGHTGSITFHWTQFFIYCSLSHRSWQSWSVKGCEYLPWYGKSNIPTLDKRWHKHTGNAQLCVIKLLLSPDKPTTYFWSLNMLWNINIVQYIHNDVDIFTATCIVITVEALYAVFEPPKIEDLAVNCQFGDKFVFFSESLVISPCLISKQLGILQYPLPTFQVLFIDASAFMRKRTWRLCQCPTYFVKYCSAIHTSCRHHCHPVDLVHRVSPSSMSKHLWKYLLHSIAQPHFQMPNYPCQVTQEVTLWYLSNLHS